MKQAKPDSLGLFVSVSPKCPFTDKELVNRFEGEFLRARLKPTNILENYGAMIVGDNKASSKQYFINTITDSVALSLTDYLKVNFQ